MKKTRPGALGWISIGTDVIDVLKAWPADQRPSDQTERSYSPNPPGLLCCPFHTW